MRRGQDSRNFQTNSLPTGYIYRFEPTKSQLAHIRANQAVTAVMLNLDKVSSLLKKGITSSFFRSDQIAITTSTISDARLPSYHVEREASIVKRFSPLFHVPCDRPVYEVQNPEERRWFIESQVRDTLELRDRIQGTRTKLLPLLKGVTDEEIMLCHNLFSKQGFNHFTYYAAQYFGKGRGRSSNVLATDIRHIISLCSLNYLLVIGLQSSNVLSKLPPEVRAHAGLSWALKIRAIEKSLQSAAASQPLLRCGEQTIFETRQSLVDAPEWYLAKDS